MVDQFIIRDGLNQKLNFNALKKPLGGVNDIYTPIQINMVYDSDGDLFDPHSCVHRYSYDASGNITSDLATDPTTLVNRIKNYTFLNNKKIMETAWNKTNQSAYSGSMNLFVPGNALIGAL
ncbi:hypothetical protein [Caulobacter phage Cr30]|uniref:hypothetical protein n=1 Tax=Caulobacter phage Cr30 TaxID=1357714 RepID=UPI0004A9B7D9|nr:hypothetical protein OZ74_gp259 [Caulobacter phage Cr30]AGS81084.1 hypothetical protein [Caulobacter phage Cr30]